MGVNLEIARTDFVADIISQTESSIPSLPNSEYSSNDNDEEENDDDDDNDDIQYY